MRKLASKIIPFEAIGALAHKLHEENKKIVTTNGCFDLLHLGHVEYLAEAKALGDALICAVNSDTSVRRLKGNHRPLINQKSRALQLAGLESVDYVTIFESATPDDFIKRVRPHFHVKGGDYSKEELPETKTVEACGGNVIVLSLVEGFSTTKLLEQIKEL